MNSSYGHFGEQIAIDVAPPVGHPAEDPSLFQLAAGYLPVAQTLAAQLQDKYKFMLKAESKLRKAKAAGMPAGFIQQLETNYAAAKRSYEKQLAGERSVEQYRLLGQVGGTVAIGVGVATIFFILTRAMR